MTGVRRLVALVALALAWPAAARAEDAPLPAAQVSQPEGWDDELRLPEAEDLDPDPHVLEISLEARIAQLEIVAGKTTPAWTYNGMLPGPVIRARKGDRLVVHFKNSLPEATTIHWHGVRVPNAMDGAPGLTQEPVPPGGAFEYDFILKDAGTFWYHPHFDSPRQVAAGLYGAIVVEDPDDPIPVKDELVVVLSDIAIAADGSLKPADRGGVFGDLFGREGDYVLVNGKIRPKLEVRAGKPVRWRVVNAASARYFPIALRHHKWTRVGGDGGLAARPEQLSRLVLAPSERADLILTPVGPPGETQTMYWMPVDRGGGTAAGQTRAALLDVERTSDPPVAPPPLPARLRDIPAIDVSHAVQRRLELNILNASDSRDMMGINGVAHHHMIMAHLGDTEVWEIVNTSDLDHPFHLHGYFFQVLDGRIPEWKDTVNVPAHETKRIAVVFDERPGTWMYHCHILDHAEVGMMGHLMVQ